MTQWIQDYLPGMEFLAEDYCPCCRQVDDDEFIAGESCE